MSAPHHLNWDDPAAVYAWLVELHVHLVDMDVIVEDMLRPIGERDLGRGMHRANYRDAREQIRAMIGFATPRPLPGFIALLSLGDDAPRPEPKGGAE